jgi:hypothetical protein
MRVADTNSVPWHLQPAANRSGPAGFFFPVLNRATLNRARLLPRRKCEPPRDRVPSTLVVNESETVSRTN